MSQRLIDQVLAEIEQTSKPFASEALKPGFIKPYRRRGADAESRILDAKVEGSAAEYFRDNERIRASAVIQCSPQHPQHKAYMDHAAANRARIAMGVCAGYFERLAA